LVKEHGKVLVIRNSLCKLYWNDEGKLMCNYIYPTYIFKTFADRFFTRVHRAKVYKIGPEEEGVLQALNEICDLIRELDLSILQYNSEFAWINPSILSELIKRSESEGTDLSAAALALAFSDDAFKDHYSNALRCAALAQRLSEFIKARQQQLKDKRDIHEQLAEKYHCVIEIIEDAAKNNFKIYRYRSSAGRERLHVDEGVKRFVEEALELVHVHGNNRSRHRVYKVSEIESEALRSITWCREINQTIAAGGLIAAAEVYKKLRRMHEDPLSDIEFIEFLARNIHYPDSLNRLATEIHTTGKSWREAAKALLERDERFREGWAEARALLGHRLQTWESLAPVLSAKGLL
jgi:hypothetical protein